MKKVLIAVLVLASSSFVLAQAGGTKASTNPVADATRSWVAREAKNLIASAEEMPADKYGYHPTEPQMTFGKLMEHIAGSNRSICSGIAGEPEPKESGVTEKDGKDKLLADVKASFDYCTTALAKVDDSKLGEEVPFFGRKVTRAWAMVALSADLTDHYAMAAMYLRMNGMLPPTAQPKK